MVKEKKCRPWHIPWVGAWCSSVRQSTAAALASHRTSSLIGPAGSRRVGKIISAAAESPDEIGGARSTLPTWKATCVYRIGGEVLVGSQQKKQNPNQTVNLSGQCWARVILSSFSNFVFTITKFTIFPLFFFCFYHHKIPNQTANGKHQASSSSLVWRTLECLNRWTSFDHSLPTMHVLSDCLLALVCRQVANPWLVL